MKIHLIIFFTLTYIFILSGCAVKTDTSATHDDKKEGLVSVNGEEVCQEVHTLKMWQFSKEGPFNSLEEADRFVEELKLGGYDDWRLPTKSELFNLFYLHYWNNDSTCMMNHAGDFWMVSESQAPDLGHWEGDLLCGPEYKFINSIKQHGYVRAIRPRFLSYILFPC